MLIAYNLFSWTTGSLPVWPAWSLWTLLPAKIGRANPARGKAMPRCADCGLLAVRHFESRRLDEVEEDSRKTWQFIQIGVQITTYKNVPICIARAWDLKKECGTDGDSVGSDIALKVINKDRKCGSFEKWHQGFSPKEHKEMQQVEALRKWQEDRLGADRNRADEQQEQAAKREEARREADRKYQENRDKENEDRQKREANRAFRRTLITTFISLFVGALFTALVTYLVKLATQN
jgi:hypothetical protein